MRLGELITKYRIETDISMREFARRSGLSPTYVSQLERGETGRGKKPAPSIETYKAVAKAMNIGIDELFAEVDDIISINADRQDYTPPCENIIPLPIMNAVPLVGTIACGEPILAEQNVECMVDVPEHIRADFALRCKGDSMINARIFDGDIVYIRSQPTVEDGQIAAVLIGDEATLKRVRLYEDHIVLEPENPMYRPIVKWGEEMKEVNILGLAVAFTAEIK